MCGIARSAIIAWHSRTSRRKLFASTHAGGQAILHAEKLMIRCFGHNSGTNLLLSREVFDTPRLTKLAGLWPKWKRRIRPAVMRSFTFGPASRFHGTIAEHLKASGLGGGDGKTSAYASSSKPLAKKKKKEKRRKTNSDLSSRVPEYAAPPALQENRFICLIIISARNRPELLVFRWGTACSSRI